MWIDVNREVNKSKLVDIFNCTYLIIVIFSRIDNKNNYLIS